MKYTTCIIVRGDGRITVRHWGTLACLGFQPHVIGGPWWWPKTVICQKTR